MTMHGQNHISFVVNLFVVLTEICVIKQFRITQRYDLTQKPASMLHTFHGKKNMIQIFVRTFSSSVSNLRVTWSSIMASTPALT